MYTFVSISFFAKAEAWGNGREDDSSRFADNDQRAVLIEDVELACSPGFCLRRARASWRISQIDLLP